MKKIFLLSIVIVVAILFYFLFPHIQDISPTAIKNWLQSFGIWAPVIFVVAYTFRPLILFPASILSLTAGLVFGAWLGWLLIILGAMGSSAVAYGMTYGGLGKFLKIDPLQKFPNFQKKLDEQGFWYIFWIRLIPVVHFDLIGYVAGATRVPFWNFMLATFLGILPGTFVYSFLGSSFTSGDWSTILLAVVLFFLVTVIPIVIQRKWKKV
ncbi:TVP38/TMEM64 family protein [Mangrovibacillus cuniculi]|uniref:TVP38/TMEM64 family membrane protein n=1 Tax=Mangrovibacillus cuniculi TaxID=2593652 RepID=A0A7S8HH70_9BACI|nr:TVP38/TMEM64 family protein [Mangrovibacillus cuniculi]QPC48170.1 TVP38/TMEM64 family protein [Mangrovibacillus cuniculi]